MIGLRFRILVFYASVAVLTCVGLSLVDDGVLVTGNSTGAYPIVAVIAAVCAVWHLAATFVHPPAQCPTCGHRRAAPGRATYNAGVVTGFASGSYAGARMARDVHAVQTGRVGNRLLNIGIGRTVVSRLYRR